ncbi:hypothetical protein GCM10023085_07950 [Actinomadura viridis]|uniref:Uncharacterized protein n=1 Tax=Actinomadura viridis TaxID=58110 RepID=A0A931GM94_9ACTN|nr:hypothetical protein [Actinomadura viridis]MBG6091805.1 hypothetical protein [Actinomadura viridis]
MTETQSEPSQDEQEPGKGAAVLGCVTILVVIVVVGGLIWGGVKLVRSFMAFESPLHYDVAKTTEVTAPAQPCHRITVPDLPEDKRRTFRAQLEHSVLEKTVRMTCDPKIKVECASDCTATYGGAKISYQVTNMGSCIDLGDTQSCKYKITARERLLAQASLNEQFWQYGKSQRKGAKLRCDTLPGGAAVIPGDPVENAGAPKAETKTKYRCYARNRVTYVYDVVAARGSGLVFEEAEVD